MNSNFKFFGAIFTIAILIATSTIGGCVISGEKTSGTDASKVEKITLLDSGGRYVEINKTVNRIVILNCNVMEMLIAMGHSDKIVGIDSTYSVNFAKKFGTYPVISNRTLCGEEENPDWETIASLKPDVVIGFNSYATDYQKMLDPFGIPYFSMELYDIDIFYQELLTLGLIVGDERSANEMVDFYKGAYDEMDTALANLTAEEMKSVYFETGMDYKTAGGTSGGYPEIIYYAHARNIFDDRFPGSYTVDPESVAQKNPDVIIRFDNGGSSDTLTNHQGKPLASGGRLVTNDSVYAMLAENIVSRPELAHTTAVKNGDVYVIGWDLGTGNRRIMCAWFVAKLLYPERLKDFDPYSYWNEYNTKFLHLQNQGIYTYSYVKST